MNIDSCDPRIVKRRYSFWGRTHAPGAPPCYKTFVIVYGGWAGNKSRTLSRREICRLVQYMHAVIQWIIFSFTDRHFALKWLTLIDDLTEEQSIM